MKSWKFKCLCNKVKKKKLVQSQYSLCHILKHVLNMLFLRQWKLQIYQLQWWKSTKDEKHSRQNSSLLSLLSAREKLSRDHLMGQHGLEYKFKLSLPYKHDDLYQHFPSHIMSLWQSYEDDMLSDVFSLQRYLLLITNEYISFLSSCFLVNFPANGQRGSQHELTMKLKLSTFIIHNFFSSHVYWTIIRRHEISYWKAPPANQTEQNV